MNGTITLPREVAKRILRNIEIGNALSAGIEMRREIEAALEQPQSPYGECDECGTPYSYDPTDGGCICVRCMKEKLATKQPQVEQEPVAWIENIGGGVSYNPYHEAARKLPDGVRFDLYTHPQPRQPLTDEEITEITFKLLNEGASMHDFARAIERAHGIGGGA